MPSLEDTTPPARVPGGKGDGRFDPVKPASNRRCKRCGVLRRISAYEIHKRKESRFINLYCMLCDLADTRPTSTNPAQIDPYDYRFRVLTAKIPPLQNNKYASPEAEKHLHLYHRGYAFPSSRTVNTAGEVLYEGNATGWRGMTRDIEEE